MHELLHFSLQATPRLLPEVRDLFEFYFRIGLRLIWISYSGSERLFVLFLGGVAIYTVWLSVVVLARVQNFKKQEASVGAGAASSVINNLGKRLRNLRQLHLFTFYLLWVVGLINLPRAFNILGSYKTIPYGVILSQLTDFFYLYPPVIFFLLLLHSMQWFVAARVDAFDRAEPARP
ncbi:MAG TPA: hypothetical protein VGJ06_06315 [Candidatus Acidoferrum sp.]